MESDMESLEYVMIICSDMHAQNFALAQILLRLW